MATAIGAFQWLSLGAFAAILAVVAALAWKRPQVRLLLVFPAAWAVFGVLLYAGVFAGVLPGDTVLIWSAAHRFLAAVMILGGLLALCLILQDGDDGYDS